MKRITALLLSLLMLLGMLTACAKPEEKEAELPTEVPATEAPTPEPTDTPAPTDTPEPTIAPSQLWAEFDDTFFKEYISSDITSLHQLVKDPAAYGIDISTVEVSLGSYSKENDEEWLQWVMEKKEQLEAIDRSGLTEQEQMAYDTVAQYLEEEIESSQFYGYYEPLNMYVGIQVDLPLVFWMYDLNTKEDVDTYLALLADVPRFFEELLAYEQYRANELGIFMTETALDSVLEDLQDILDEGEDIFLVSTFEEALDGIEGLTKDEISAYKKQNKSLLKNEFHNAYQALHDGLEELRPLCREATGVYNTGNETYKAFYDYWVKHVCADDVDVEAVMDLLFTELLYTYQEYMAVYNEYGDDIEIPMSYTAGTTEENIAYLHEVLDPLLPEIGEVSVRYENVPKALQDMFSPAAYLVASYDQWQDNVIILNQPEEDDTILFTLAHEGFNGHLYQYMYHRSMEGLSKSQQLLEPTAYAEAWSQYSERLFAFNQTKFDTNGSILHHSDSMFNTLLVTFCTLVANGMDVDKAGFISTIQSFFNLPDESLEAIYEICVDMPYYYLPYAYGYAKLRYLEQTAEEEQGEAFDQKAFFTEYLNCGPSYFNLIEARLSAE